MLRQPPSAVTNLVDLLQMRSAATPDRTAFIFLQDGETEQCRLTYAAIDAQARAIAAWLQQQPVREQPVLLACPTGPEFVGALFGCLYAGTIAVPVPAPTGRRTLPRLAAIAHHTGAPIALTTAATRTSLAAHPALQRVHWQVIEAIDPTLATAWCPHPIDPDAIALLQYTSGSTARPKGVILSHANLLANTAQISLACALSPASIGVSWAPLHHDMGLIGTILMPVYVGMPAVLMPPTAFTERPMRWLEAISRYRATISTAPDFAYALCADRIPAEQRAKLDLSTWQVALCGSEPVRAATMERFAYAFASSGFRPERLRPTYGLAEAALMVSVCQETVVPHSKGRVIPGADQPMVSCGSPVAGVEICIVDPAARVRVETAQIGEIWVRGPNVARGYWNDADATAAAFNAMLSDSGEGPFLRTGDLGCIQEGQLFIVGRLKDLIVVNGENYYPEDIEAVVMHEEAVAVASAASFAVDTDERTQLVLLLERQREWRHGADPEQLQTLARRAQRLVAQTTGLQVDAVAVMRPATLPRTTSGKIQRHLCRDLYLAGQLPGVEFLLPPQAAHELPHAEPATTVAGEQPDRVWVLAWLAEQVGSDVATLDLGQPLSSIGLGSLQTALLLARLETRLGITLPRTQLATAITLGDLLSIIASSARKSARPAPH